MVLFTLLVKKHWTPAKWPMQPECYYSLPVPGDNMQVHCKIPPPPSISSGFPDNSQGLQHGPSTQSPAQ